MLAAQVEGIFERHLGDEQRSRTDGDQRDHRHGQIAQQVGHPLLNQCADIPTAPSAASNLVAGIGPVHSDPPLLDQLVAVGRAGFSSIPHEIHGVAGVSWILVGWVDIDQANRRKPQGHSLNQREQAKHKNHRASHTQGVRQRQLVTEMTPDQPYARSAQHNRNAPRSPTKYLPDQRQPGARERARRAREKAEQGNQGYHDQRDAQNIEFCVQ